MSEPKYPPYGEDHDPFMTPPAGAGHVRNPSLRDEFGYHARNWGGQNAPAPDHVPQQYHGYDAPLGGYGADSFDQHGYFLGHQPHHNERPQRLQAAALPPSVAPYPQDGFAPRRAFTARSPARDMSLDQPMGDYPLAPAQRMGSYDDHQDAAYRAPAQRPPAPRAPSFSAPPRAASYAIDRASAPPMAQHGRAGLHQRQQPPEMSHPAPSYPEPMARHGAYARGDGAAISSGAGGFMQWAGAICTLAFVIGAALWGYELAMRDANGIPVVRAAAGPSRVAPETPGGQVSAHQGLAVNAIPAAQAVPNMPEQITFAPQPDTVTADDIAVPIVEQGSFARSSGEGSAASLAGASDSAPPLDAQAPATMTPAPDTGALVTDLASLPESLPEVMPMTDAEAVERALEAALAEEGAVILAASGDLAPTKTATPNADGVTEIDPATIALGTPLVQLGAFDSDATARAEWAQLQTRFGELMSGKALVVEKAKSGGRDFYRLRAHGFASADDTRRFCAAVLAENGSCFPVDQR